MIDQGDIHHCGYCIGSDIKWSTIARISHIILGITGNRVRGGTTATPGMVPSPVEASKWRDCAHAGTADNYFYGGNATRAQTGLRNVVSRSILNEVDVYYQQVWVEKAVDGQVYIQAGVGNLCTNDNQG
jgi:hypothetical protein